MSTANKKISASSDTPGEVAHRVGTRCIHAYAANSELLDKLMVELDHIFCMVDAGDNWADRLQSVTRTASG